jgi:hypothetical protein
MLVCDQILSIKTISPESRPYLCPPLPRPAHFVSTPILAISPVGKSNTYLTNRPRICGVPLLNIGHSLYELLEMP